MLSLSRHVPRRLRGSWTHSDRFVVRFLVTESVDRRAIADERIETSGDTEKIEKEANDIASDALIPRAVWRRSEAFANPSSKSIQALAADLQVSPAVVAGRVRHERGNYALFSGLVGYRQVRVQFPEVRWA